VREIERAREKDRREMGGEREREKGEERETDTHRERGEWWSEKEREVRGSWRVQQRLCEIKLVTEK